MRNSIPEEDIKRIVSRRDVGHAAHSLAMSYRYVTYDSREDYLAASMLALAEKWIPGQTDYYWAMVAKHGMLDYARKQVSLVCPWLGRWLSRHLSEDESFNLRTEVRFRSDSNDLDLPDERSSFDDLIYQQELSSGIESVLSNEEMNILHWMTRDYTNAAIGEIIGINRKTVGKVRAEIKAKANADR